MFGLNSISSDLNKAQPSSKGQKDKQIENDKVKELNSDHFKETKILDFSHPSIQLLVENKQWKELSHYDAIGEIYTFVRDDIQFGYNFDDQIPASSVLRDGYGQCNTKGTLLMAILRAVGIPNRLRGSTIFNDLQKGAIPNYLFALAPKKIIHSWVEVHLGGVWINLEGYILDRQYLEKVQKSFSEECEAFSGFAIATKCLKNPPIDWNGNDTFIQSEGIADDYGVYSQPDDFYSKYGSNLSGLKKWFFQYVFRHLMNANVNNIRSYGVNR